LTTASPSFVIELNGSTLFITDAANEDQTVGCVTFKPTDQKKTYEELIKTCSEYAPLNGKFAATKQDLQCKLANIYFAYEEEQRAKQAEKDAAKKEPKDEVKEKKQIPVMKYTQDGMLFEAVILGGSTVFVTFQQNKLTVVSSIADPERIFLPVAEDEPMPYRYSGLEGLELYLKAAKQETLQSLYDKAKVIVADYCDTEPAYVNLLAADLVFTYFQDRIGMTHYILLIGLPNTGKGAILETAHQLAYRAVIVASATSASVFRTLGTTEPGQACILIDEANNLADNEELQVVLKTGYKQNGTIPRVLDGSSAVHTMPTYFKTFGWKIVIAEDIKAEWKAKGFLTRCFRITSYYGIPKKKIDQVITASNVELKAEYDKLVDLRKLLFAYRLLHFNEPIPSVKLNIDGRDEELCLPLVRLFRNEPKALEEILSTLSDLVIEKQSDKADDFEAYVYNTVKEIAEAGQNKDVVGYELKFATVWTTLKDLLKGTDIQDKPQSMHTDRFGDISKTLVGSVFKRFGAKKGEDNEGKRIFRLNPAKFAKFAAMYVIPEGVKILDNTAPPSPEPSGDSENETDGFAASRQSPEIHETDGQTVQTVLEVKEGINQNNVLELAAKTIDFSPLIKQTWRKKLQGYYCTVHPGEFNVNVESIQHHCRVSEPEFHLASLEALKSQLSASMSQNEAAAKPVTQT